MSMYVCVSVFKSGYDANDPYNTYTFLGGGLKPFILINLSLLSCYHIIPSLPIHTATTITTTTTYNNNNNNNKK